MWTYSYARKKLRENLSKSEAVKFSTAIRIGYTLISVRKLQISNFGEELGDREKD